MCAAPLSMADVFLLGSIVMLVVVLLIEACAFLYRHQSKPDTLNQRLSNN
jgi:hypothetical protein